MSACPSIFVSWDVVEVRWTVQQGYNQRVLKRWAWKKLEIQSRPERQSPAGKEIRDSLKEKSPVRGRSRCESNFKRSQFVDRFTKVGGSGLLSDSKVVVQ